MSQVEDVVRGVEIAGGLVATLATTITRLIQEGQDEEEATRQALLEVARLKPLVPVRPMVERMIAEARKPTLAVRPPIVLPEDEDEG